jgi:hypothetical protein
VRQITDHFLDELDQEITRGRGDPNRPGIHGDPGRPHNPGAILKRQALPLRAGLGESPHGHAAALAKHLCDLTSGFAFGRGAEGVPGPDRQAPKYENCWGPCISNDVIQ